MLKATFQALRVYQWSKNLLVLAALIFAQQLFEPGQVMRAVVAFMSFCLASSATYVFNDIMDIEKDRAHPKKRLRPLPSGAMSMGMAWALVVVLLGGSVALALSVRIEFLYAVLFYLALTVSYSIVLKHLVLIDVMAIALGFVARAMAGAIALDVTFSNWLVVCTLFLAMFLGLSKRRQELILLEDGAHTHRQVLHHYTTQYLDQRMGDLAQRLSAEEA